MTAQDIINQQNQPKTYRVLASRKGMSNEDWLKIRKGYLNISEVSVALNLNPYKTALNLWASKTGIYEEPYTDNRFCEWGRIMEPVLLDYYQKQYDCKVQTVPYILQSTQYNFICGNIDGVAIFPDGSKKIIEVKTTSSINESEWKDGGCPIYFYTQLMLYEWLTGVHSGQLIVLIGGNDFRVVDIPYNQDVVDAILAQCVDFWNHVATRQPLQPVAKDSSFLGKLFPQSNGNVIQLEDSFTEKLAQLEALKQKESEIKAAKDTIEAEIKQAMGENELAIVSNWKVSWKSSSRNTFSAELAKQYLTDEQVKACMQTSSTRTMRVTKAKPKAASSKKK